MITHDILSFLHQRNSIALEQYPPHIRPLLRLDVNLLRSIQYEIHVFVKAYNLTLDCHTRIFVQPDFDSRLFLYGVCEWKKVGWLDECCDGI